MAAPIKSEILEKFEHEPVPIYDLALLMDSEDGAMLEGNFILILAPRDGKPQIQSGNFVCFLRDDGLSFPEYKSFQICNHPEKGESGSWFFIHEENFTDMGGYVQNIWTEGSKVSLFRLFPKPN